MEASGYREDTPTPVGASADLVEFDVGIPARSPWQLFWRRFREDKLALASLIFIVLLIVIAIFAPLVVEILGIAGPGRARHGGPRPRLRGPYRARARSTCSAWTRSAATS